MGLCNGFQFRHLGQGGLTFISFPLTTAKRGWPTGVVSARHLPTGASNSKCIILFCNLKYFCQEIAKTCQRTPSCVRSCLVPRSIVSAPRFGRACSQIRACLGAEAVASRPVCAERHRPQMEREWFHLCHLPFSGICQPCVSEKQESGKSAAERMAADLPDSFCISEMSQ